jgi:hypothetical protein
MTLQVFMQAKRTLEAAKEKATEEIKAALPAMVKPIFDADPRQYTPGFNDGDACVFSVSGPELYGDCEDEDCAHESCSDCEIQHQTWDRASNQIITSPLTAPVKSFADTLYVGKELLEDAFGNGAKVTIFRDLSVTVEEYDCGY